MDTHDITGMAKDYKTFASDTTPSRIPRLMAMTVLKMWTLGRIMILTTVRLGNGLKINRKVQGRGHG